jgi:hypothetical protein
MLHPLQAALPTRTDGANPSPAELSQAQRETTFPQWGSARLAWGVHRRPNLGCAHCAHFASRTGSYKGRIGPDSTCFRDFPTFAGAGMQFESHLGHVFPLVRGGFAFNVLTLTLRGPSDSGRGLCLAPRWPVKLCGWRGQGPWLVGPPPAGMWGYLSPSLACHGGRGWPSLLHGYGLY